MLIDLTKELLPQFENIKAHIKKELNETWVVFTKADKFKDLDEQELFLVEKAREIHPIAKYFIAPRQAIICTNLLALFVIKHQRDLTCITKGKSRINMFDFLLLNM